MTRPPLGDLRDQILERFACQQSGNCCKKEGFVYVTLAELTEMAAFLGISAEDFVHTYVRRHNGWMVISSPTHRPGCFVSPQNTCDIYPARPHSCRTYPTWSEIWESEETILAELALCPGLKKAFDEVLLDHLPHH
jgi:uncharacterized protein